ncbi:hypothetical protein RB195_014031 [Necator americanus]|uniref:Reverse transcriptase domain-containing protein n=1 Tax=Necator americanus TaxID=51031 RepID=A0ABR1DYA7_NECAM
MTALRNPKATTTASRRRIEKIIHDFDFDLFESHVHLPPHHLREDGHVISQVLPSEVRRAIMSVRNHNVAGADRMKSEYLKYLPPVLINTLARLFVRYLSECKGPKKQKTSKTVLLYKKGDPHDTGNYRPICLLSVEKSWMKQSQVSKQAFKKDPTRLTTFTLFQNSSRYHESTRCRSVSIPRVEERLRLS